jgi:hypothetical protein
MCDGSLLNALLILAPMADIFRDRDDLVEFAWEGGRVV